MPAGDDPHRMELRLIGPMSIACDGETAALPASKKTRALLAYLALAARPVRRERLCELFWELPDDPRGSLRWSLSKLRAVVDTPDRRRLRADRETVSLDLSGARFDWRDLRELCGVDLANQPVAALGAAAMTGEFIEGLDLPRCDGFQAWCIAEREDVRQRLTRVHAELARRDIEPERALAHAREWVRLDPFDAAAKVALVELLDRTGRTGEAGPQRALGIRILADADIAAPSALRGKSRKAAAATPLQPRTQQVHFCRATDGTGLAYSLVGSGPPLVKAANWLNHLEYDFDSPVWRHWIAAFGSDRTLLRYDERGNGLSDWRAELTFEAFVDDLESVVDAAGFEQFDLLAISQGASVAIAYAIRHPERVRKLVIHGGFAMGWAVRASPEEVARRSAMLTLTREGWGLDNPAFRQMFTTLYLPDATTEQMDWFNEMQRMTTSPANAEALQRVLSMIDVRKLLNRVTTPTLVLHANADAVIPFDAGRGIASGIPGARFVALESRNHLLLEHEPAWAKFVAAVKAFLDD